MTFFVIADLSDCQLMQIPDAVYHLMRNTVLKTCDLSTNDIKKIGPNFATKFPEITGKSLKNIYIIIKLHLPSQQIMIHMNSHL